jgi:hypothetical protein
VLLVSSAFNSMTQRFFVELSDAGHEVAVEEVRTERQGDIIHLRFDFHNGAMSTAQCAGSGPRSSRRGPVRPR